MKEEKHSDPERGKQAEGQGKRKKISLAGTAFVIEARMQHFILCLLKVKAYPAPYSNEMGRPNR